MDKTQVALIAASLSGSQRTYLLAVGSSVGGYLPRHGRTANWALRHGYADTLVKLNDGRQGLWHDFEAGDRMQVGVADIGGQLLTPLGLAVRSYLESQTK